LKYHILFVINVYPTELLYQTLIMIGQH